MSTLDIHGDDDQIVLKVSAGRGNALPGADGDRLLVDLLESIDA